MSSEKKSISLQAEMVAYTILFWKITLVRALVSISHFQSISAGGSFMLQDPLRWNVAVGKFFSSYIVFLHGKLALETWF